MPVCVLGLTSNVKVESTVHVVLLSTIRSPCIRSCASLLAVSECVSSSLWGFTNRNHTRFFHSDHWWLFGALLCSLLCREVPATTLCGGQQLCRVGSLLPYLCSFSGFEPRLPGFGGRVLIINGCFLSPPSSLLFELSLSFTHLYCVFARSLCFTWGKILPCIPN